jgi:uncharacterized membrane protein YozB (DUF420 family)
MEKAYRNISYLFLLILGFAIVGFFQSYFGLFPRFQGLPAVAHLHAIGLLLWFGLLIIQPILIRYNRIELHRLLGKFSYFLVPYIALTVFGMARHSYRAKGASWLLAANPPSLFFVFIGLLPFLLFYILAIVYRRNTEYHMRFIIATSLPLIPPALGRFLDLRLKLGPPGAVLPPLTVLLILIGLMIYDKVELGRVHRAYWIVLLVILLVDVSVPTIAPSHWWQSVALKIGQFL